MIIRQSRLRSRWFAGVLALATACVAVPAPPPRVAPRAMEASDRAPAGRGALLVDVTNADARVRAGRNCAACQTPCVLMLAPGRHRLLFEYEQNGRKASDEASVTLAEQPQVYRRTLRETHVRSPAGRLTAIALWAVGQAAMATALGLLAADDADAAQKARRGLGFGGLGATALMFPVALLSVRRTPGVGVQFPWEAPAR